MVCNLDEICKTVNVLKYGELFEIRILDGKKAYSGYFKDTVALQRELEEINVSADASVYFTINAVKAECGSRKQNNRLTCGCTTTADNDIDRYKLIMVDIDPERVSGVSSSDEELAYAWGMLLKVGAYLKNNGFSSPLVALSGNGYHLLYKIDLPNTKETKNLIKSFLETLDALFSDNKCHVDTVNFNPARICKLYGTYATKGSNTPERPHRLSKIIKIPEIFEITDISVIKRVVNINRPQEAEKEKPSRYNDYKPQPHSTVEDFISKYGINVKETVKISNGIKYVLDCCPFNGLHTGKDACLFQYDSGGKHFHCFHNGCSDKTWKDFRLLYEPDAYSKNYNFTPTPNRYSMLPVTQPSSAIQNSPPTKEPGDIWLTAEEIRANKQKEWEFIPTGVKGIDNSIGGIAKGRVVLVSGLRASGKSSLIGQFAIEAVQKDYRVAMYSGELSSYNVLKWLTLQIAGKSYTKPTIKRVSVVDESVQERIDKWLDDKLLIYNNDYGNKISVLLSEVEKTIIEKKVDMVIIDNLMTLDISELSLQPNEQQKKLMQSLKALANKYNVAIVFVAHPRKTLGFLRLEDVAGSNDIVNIVDDAIIVHRNNLDFRRKFDETMKGEKSSDEFSDASNIIEIAKNRDLGVQDEFIKLYYCPGDKRLRNSKDENKMYGWIDIETEKSKEETTDYVTKFDMVDESAILF